MLFSLPFMASIQEISARIGRCTGHGIAGNLARHYSPWLLYSMVLLLAAANIFNLAADLSAMGDACRLLWGGSPLLYSLLLALACLILEIRLSYPEYAKFLKWCTLALFSYVATLFVVRVPWAQTLRS